ncbi:AMP-dependent synthetase [Nocardia panacis]|uniref:AMP-dependent synthetase n=1 Tax=Nocardia panacis TaxID=2340916 RepID=A0A3A4K940_9NOCA|nr:AMP-dependent synthetase [Nocardia panacis]
MPPIVARLKSHDDRIAVLCAHATAANVTAAQPVTEDLRAITYARLAALVGAYAAELGPNRRLVAIAARNDLESLVAYLGTLAAGGVALLAERITDELVAVYDPDVVVDGGFRQIRHGLSRHALHPELALLLSTSGSTGSPKLVRLSRANLRANAESIAEYLAIGPTDRAATTLPMFYCYGLSVVHSHLLRGASLLLTERSVLDERFWVEFRAHRATSFAAVPHTVDLLDRIGFDRMRLPDLRVLTQAGGRLAPEQVRRYARLGAESGWDFVVMYGQTEATARMAYLPAELADRHPDCIGVPIPGGRFTLEPVAGEAAAELIYHGPNVMLGYANSPADLALGGTVAALRTGDLARRTPEGLYQIVGRRNRFAKLFGLRIDLQRLESGLAASGFTACCTEDGEQVVCAVLGDHVHAAAGAAALTGLPADAIRICPVAELPRLANGKPDYPAIRGLRTAQPATPPRDLCALYAETLGLPRHCVRADRTFVELGGTSLTYIATSVKLQRALGALPPNWPERTIAELAARPRERGRFGRTLDTATALRAAGMVLIAGSHIGLFMLLGAAHVLLAAAGYNFARFAVTAAPRADRPRRGLRTAALIAAPTATWVALTLPFSDYYGWQNLLLLNKILGPHDSPTAGHLWFLEVLVYFMVGAALLLRIPRLDALERRDPFRFALGLFALTLIFRYFTFDLYAAEQVPFSPLTIWFFTLGWAAAKARDTWQRMLLGVLVLVTVPGYFDTGERERLVIAGVLLLVLAPALRVPALIAGAAALLADASLYVYLLHWQVYPLFGPHRPAALAACLAAGIAIARTVALLRRRGRAHSALDGPQPRGGVLGEFGDQDIARNRLTGKVIE